MNSHPRLSFAIHRHLTLHVFLIVSSLSSHFFLSVCTSRSEKNLFIQHEATSLRNLPFPGICRGAPSPAHQQQLWRRLFEFHHGRERPRSRHFLGISSLRRLHVPHALGLVDQSFQQLFVLCRSGRSNLAAICRRESQCARDWTGLTNPRRQQRCVECLA